MHAAAHLLARARKSSGNILQRPASIALLPPLQLYRRLLRAHRHKLPAEARLIGDEYVKSEFRLHRDIDNPMHIVGFLMEWQLYAQELEGDTWRDKKLEEKKLEKMSDEQIRQLYKLMMAVKGQAQTDAAETEREAYEGSSGSSNGEGEKR